MKVTSFSQKIAWQRKGITHELPTPCAMGILNVTPDSFFAGSRVSVEEIVSRAGQMLDNGAQVIDIGGMSTRPGAEMIPPELELERVNPAILEIKKHFPDCYLSIDTFRSDVAKQAVENGADIVNDISGGQLDEQMFQTVVDLQVPYIMMHSRGTPETMKNLTDYDDLVQDVIHFFQERLQRLKSLGAVSPIVIDPGFGFAKTIQQNFELMKKLDALNSLDLPMLVGVSRKSMIFRTLGISQDEALNGTTVLNTAALLKGADIIRVHDVKAAVEAIRLTNELKA